MRALTDRFRYHATNDAQRNAMGVVRDRCLAAAAAIAAQTPEPEMSRAVDLLEQAMFVANAGIARDGSALSHARNRDTDLGQIAVAQMIADAKESGILARDISDDAARAVMLRGLLA